MINLDIVLVRGEAVRAVSLVVAIRRLAKYVGLDTEDLGYMEREFRYAEAELRRVEKAMAEGATLS